MRTLCGIIAAVTLMLLTVVRAGADVTFNLTPTTINAKPGDTLSLLGTIVNQSGGDIFLNGASGTINGPDNTAVNFNDDTFLNNLPFSLSDGQSYQNDIQVQVASTSPLGPYTFTYTINGNYSDPGMLFDISDSAIVTVVNPSAAVPEAGSVTLLGFGLVGLGVSLRRAQSCRALESL